MFNFETGSSVAATDTFRAPGSFAPIGIAQCLDAAQIHCYGVNACKGYRWVIITAKAGTATSARWLQGAVERSLPAQVCSE